MSRIGITIPFAVLVLSSSCTWAAGGNISTGAKTQTLPKQSHVALKDESYAVGYEVARSIRALLDKTEKEHPNLAFDRNEVIEGMSDSLLKKKPKLDKSARNDALTHLDTLTNSQHENLLLDKNYQEGLLAQAKAKKMPGAMATPSGLLYRVIKHNDTGKKPNINSLVTLKYTGSLVNGTVFDSSQWRENASRFVVKDLNKGLREGILLMKEGEEYEFIIKPELAFHNVPQPNIPPNSTLYYDIVLEKVK